MGNVEYVSHVSLYSKQRFTLVLFHPNFSLFYTFCVLGKKPAMMPNKGKKALT